MRLKLLNVLRPALPGGSFVFAVARLPGTSPHAPRLGASSCHWQRATSTARALLGFTPFLFASAFLVRPCNKKPSSCDTDFLSEDGLAFLEEAGIYLPVKLFLIGSTGAGKSALGNFILDPVDEHIFEQQTFTTGETCESCTETCKIGDKGRGVVVVDTPGFHESHVRDLGHMINVARTFHSISTVHGVILVKQCDSRLDQPWRDTVLYYKELLGPAMQTHVMLVLTGCDTSKLGKRRKAFGDQQAAKITQTAEEVQRLLELPTKPVVFRIDTLPEEEQAYTKSCQVRQDILRHAARRRPAALKELQVPKTPLLKQQDEAEAVQLEGQIRDMEVQLKGLKVFAWSSRVDFSNLNAAQAKRQIAKMKESNEVQGDPELRDRCAALTRSIAEKQSRIRQLRGSYMALDEADHRFEACCREQSNEAEERRPDG